MEELQAPVKYALNGGPFGSKLVSRMYVDDGIPVIRGANLPMGARFNLKEFVFVTKEKAAELHANTARPGDVVFTQRGTLGQVGLIPNDSPYPLYVISQSQMKLTVNSCLADATYIYYLFRSPEIVRRLISHESSSGVPHINLETLRKFQVTLPTLRIQKRIASILSAYDDLIENNTRRIAILEEMTRRLYEEWFVRGRPDANNLNDGWLWITLKEICERGGGSIQTGPFGSQLHQRDYIDHGVAVVMPKNLKANRIDIAGCAKVSKEDAERLSKHRLEVNDIVFARRGEIGRKAFVRDDDAGALCGTGCLKVSFGTPLVTPHYIDKYLAEDATVASLVGRAIGATMANINTSILAETRIPLPPENRLKAFGTFCDSIDRLSTNLSHTNANLRTQRDLLLPKLISGEIDVSTAEKTLEDAA